jgi:hypothetical protein
MASATSMGSSRASEGSSGRPVSSFLPVIRGRAGRLYSRAADWLSTKGFFSSMNISSCLPAANPVMPSDSSGQIMPTL